EPAAVACAGTVAATFALREVRPLDRSRVETESANFGFGRRKRRGALFADFADQALGHEAAGRGGYKEWLEADINQTRDGAGSIVGVKRREYQMAGERGIDGDSGGFDVTNFPDHDHVRRLAENRTQCHRKVEPDGLVHLHLVDTGEQIFDRIFDGDDLS